MHNVSFLHMLPTTWPRKQLLMTLLLGTALIGCGRLGPRSEADFLKRGKDLAASKDYGRAILEFQNAVKLAPRDPVPHYELGQMYLQTGDYRQALNEFRRCLSLDPAHPGAKLKVAQMMATSRDKETLSKAAGQLRELVESSPENVSVLSTSVLFGKFFVFGRSMAERAGSRR